MDKRPMVRLATKDDVRWIEDLSTRVQQRLTASGSLQEIEPVSLPGIEASIQRGYIYVLELDGMRMGSVLVEPLVDPFVVSPSPHDIWGLGSLPIPHWHLHGLRIEPNEQGHGLGGIFLAGLFQLRKNQAGTVVLDCWAGNIKLRGFYEKAGFTHHGNFPENDYEISVYVFPIPEPA